MDFLKMELLLENILIYSSTAVLCIAVVLIYIRKKNRDSKIVGEKIRRAREDGLHEPVSLHPVIDANRCILTGACVRACPEHDIIGIRNGRTVIINASRCIGHGACFHACPTEAISLHIGTEQRGVDLPQVDQNFETNIPGIYIAGEMGGMGLIKNAVEQGRQAVENIAKSLGKQHLAEYDLIIVGAGPAGISGALTAKKHDLKFLIIEQDTLGGTVFTFPRSKIVMTSPMDLPLFGKIKLYQTTKSELLDLWQTVIRRNNIAICENTKVETIVKVDNTFSVTTARGEKYTSSRILLSIGRRGTPRKLNVPGELQEKVAYRLLDPENIAGKQILIVGGGDSAVESALLLADNNRVTISYRGESFSRIKLLNSEAITNAAEAGSVDLMFNTIVTSIDTETVSIENVKTGEKTTFANHLVYIFAGGELPTQFLEKSGIRITRKFGEAILKH